MQLHQVEAIAVAGMAAEPTVDGGHILAKIDDAKGGHVVLAFSRAYLPEALGRLVMALGKASEIADKSEVPIILPVIEAADVSGSDKERLVTVGFRISNDAKLELALSPEHAKSLSEALGNAAAQFLSKPTRLISLFPTR
jgi:hypothetical protein